MLKNLILLIVLLNFWSDTKRSEDNIYFDIVHKKKVIGNLKASRTITDSKIHYQSSTTINTRIMKEIRVNYKYDVTFEAQLLEKSDVNITVNENPHAKTETEWEDNSYQVIKNGKYENRINDSISYSTVQMFFNEPVNINTCYSEQNGSFNTIIELGNHTYKKINSKGNENIYYYDMGVLKKATIDVGLITFEIVASNKH
ncbi:DUF6134 family protein [Psychroserpens sp. AS72]|uniref:DUF6134 family protein n=1 Tax=Psychroserpens sp. AS72 TaxID=3135775 RepID=UPI0031791FC4